MAVPVAGPRPLPLARAAAAGDRPIPLADFALGHGWFLLGAAGLVAVAPQLAAGALLDPRVIAVTHCFTLGLVVSTAAGVMQQFGGEQFGVDAPPPGRAALRRGLHAAGTALVVAGTWAWRPGAAGIGWLLVLGGLAVLAHDVLLPAARRAAPDGVPRLAALAWGALALAILVAGSRLGHALGWWMLPRGAVLFAHAHLALAGFGLTLVAAMGSRILPLLLGVAPHGGRPARVVAALALPGAVLGAWRPAAGAVLLASAAAVFLAEQRRRFAARTDRAMDPPLRLIAGACLALAAGAGAGLAGALGGPQASAAAAAYGTLVVAGFLALMTIGVAGRMVPHLLWVRAVRARPRAPLPPVATLAEPRLAAAAAALLLAGLAALAAGTLGGREGLAVAGASLYAAGALAQAAHHARLARRVAGLTAR